MILDSLWHLLQSQINKLANFFWQADPIALMQAEYDHAVAQLREGRIGLEQYRAFVERVGRQVARHETHVKRLEDTVKNYLRTRRSRDRRQVRARAPAAPGELAGKRSSALACTSKPTRTTCSRSSMPAASSRRSATRSPSTTPTSR